MQDLNCTDLEKAAAALCIGLMYRCINVPYACFFFLQTFNKTSQNSTPVISSYAPCTHIQGSRTFCKGFLTTTVSVRTSICTRQPIYWTPMLSFPVQFPSWHQWCTESFHSGSPAGGHFNTLNAYSLATSASVSETSSQSKPPISERRLILVRQELHLLHAQCLLIPANRIIQWALEHCKDANSAAWPRACVRPVVRFIWPFSDVHNHREVGMQESSGERRGS